MIDRKKEGKRKVKKTTKKLLKKKRGIVKKDRIVK